MNTDNSPATINLPLSYARIKSQLCIALCIVFTEKKPVCFFTLLQEQEAQLSQRQRDASFHLLSHSRSFEMTPSLKYGVVKSLLVLVFPSRTASEIFSVK